ncbi:DUF6731 family protein [Lactobacillus bombicola]|uniref:Uncharacterized protein n=1 Tax=Lactobacillus bombicola TaxID=1505723 RepID=A0A396T379_9LACO|nr:DUF6731 family protein [Lactobacillus bombicola]RHW53703.1 hypothetical protein DS835_07100 [Lactobacillus bombicola]
MSDLKINFNYASPTIEFLKNKQEDKKSNYYNMKGFCEWLIKNKNIKKTTRPKINVPLANGEFAGIEWKDCDYDEQNDLYYFRLKKLRSNNIPAYSYTDSDSENIKLKENQYLGEFNLIIFDPKIKKIVIQRNSSGLSLGQIATALTAMRLSRLKDDNIEFNDEDSGSVKLRLILDMEKVKDVKNNDIYRSYELKVADINELKDANIDTNAIDGAINMVDEVDGLSINVKVSLGRESKEKSLKKSLIHKIMDNVLKIRNPRKVSMKLKSRKTIDDAIDEVDLLAPKLSSTIFLKNTRRSTIGAEYVYTNFLEQNYLNGMRSKAERDSA